MLLYRLNFDTHFLLGETKDFHRSKSRDGTPLFLVFNNKCKRLYQSVLILIFLLRAVLQRF